MVYVNKLGNIVHSATHAYYGMANKNVGDAFLLSWKICDGELEGFARFEDLASEEQRLNANDSVRCPALHPSTRGKRFITPSEMADASVNAFLKCIIDLENENETGCLAEYATYPAVLKRFGEGFKIKMGFGMHVVSWKGNNRSSAGLPTKGEENSKAKQQMEASVAKATGPWTCSRRRGPPEDRRRPW